MVAVIVVGFSLVGSGASAVGGGLVAQCQVAPVAAVRNSPTDIVLHAASDPDEGVRREMLHHSALQSADLGASSLTGLKWWLEDHAPFSRLFDACLLLVRSTRERGKEVSPAGYKCWLPHCRMSHSNSALFRYRFGTLMAT